MMSLMLFSGGLGSTSKERLQKPRTSVMNQLVSHRIIPQKPEPLVTWGTLQTTCVLFLYLVLCAWMAVFCLFCLFVWICFSFSFFRASSHPPHFQQNWRSSHDCVLGSYLVMTWIFLCCCHLSSRSGVHVSQFIKSLRWKAK